MGLSNTGDKKDLSKGGGGGETATEDITVIPGHGHQVTALSFILLHFPRTFAVKELHL